MEGLILRAATPGDTNRIADIIHGEPGVEAVALLGGAEHARALGMAIVRLPNSPQGWRRTVIAEANRKVVGIIQAGHQAEFRLSPRLVYVALHLLGPIGVLRAVPRMRARRRVEQCAPDGAYHIEEIHVDPRHRGRGIGGALLDYAASEARRRAFEQMSLTTTTVNPARRLYERHGFRIVETKTDAAYERYTGIEGRHLMVKELDLPSVQTAADALD
ncbi:MAG TPA: GNAT family N-acetyltransferase [Dehalococcoidia bacterium]|jgi:ribosomal protein S18 acetylase RimI-like enzyme|nr:GNAT family N-acetyltransferase [Dehalococcoidia bacterium]